MPDRILEAGLAAERFVQGAGLGADLDETEVRSLQPIMPAEFAQQIVDPDPLKVAVQCAVLLTLSDGAISDIERARSGEYAAALGLAAEYPQIEANIQRWIESSNIEAPFCPFSVDPGRRERVLVQAIDHSHGRRASSNLARFISASSSSCLAPIRCPSLTTARSPCTRSVKPGTRHAGYGTPPGHP